MTFTATLTFCRTCNPILKEATQDILSKQKIRYDFRYVEMANGGSIRESWTVIYCGKDVAHSLHMLFIQEELTKFIRQEMWNQATEGLPLYFEENQVGYDSDCRKE